MLLRNVFISMVFVALISSCTSLTDCECTIKDRETGSSVVHDTYDYEGSCSDLADDADGEESVSCVAK